MDTGGLGVYRPGVLRPLAWALAGAAALLACAAPAPPPAPVVAEVVPMVEAPRPAGPSCRALVNLLAEGGEYVVADVRVAGDGIEARTGAGTVVRDAEGLHGLWITSHGDARISWQVLMGQSLRGGPRIAWLDNDPGIPSDPARPCTPEHACDRSTWTAHHPIEILGTFGPYVSLFVMQEGFAGGAHGYDNSGPRTLQAPAGAPAEGLLDASALPQIQRAITADPEYAELDEPKPAVAAITDLREFGLALRPLADRGQAGATSPGGLYLSATLHCCSWAQNHNKYALELRLDPVPEALAPFSVDAQSGVSVAPDGCASVDSVRGEFAAAGGARRALPGQVLGVYWIDPGDPFDVGRLPGPSPQLAEAQAEVQAGRYAEAVARLQALIRESGPEAQALAELGWALFHAGQLEEAERVTHEALELTRSDRLKGALLYNLGRMAEARGEVAAAIERYVESLAVRDSRTVQRRLDRLKRSGAK